MDHTTITQLPQIVCNNHRDEIITNFCCLKTCLTPLCPECIDNHNKQHKTHAEFPEIDTLRRVKVMCTKQVNHGINVIEEELSRLEKYNNMSIDDIVNEGTAEMNAARQKMHRIIDQYFDAIEQDYANKIKLNVGKFFDFRDLIEELELLLGELKRLDSQLESNQLIDAIRRVSSLDMREMTITYQSKVDEILDRRLKLPVSVVFNDNDARNFKNDLDKYVRVQEKKIGISKDSVTDRIHSRNLRLENDEANAYFERKFKQSNNY